jgi:hypothetical protein
MDLQTLGSISVLLLASRASEMATRTVGIATVRNLFVRPNFAFNNPEEDFAFFHTKRFENGEPWKSLNSTGTWNYPIVVMYTPDGVLSKGKREEVSFCLIEGHQRRRFLLAWHERARLAERHSVFVLTS